MLPRIRTIINRSNQASRLFSSKLQSHANSFSSKETSDKINKTLTKSNNILSERSKMNLFGTIGLIGVGTAINFYSNNLAACFVENDVSDATYDVSDVPKKTNEIDLTEQEILDRAEEIKNILNRAVQINQRRIDEIERKKKDDIRRNMYTKKLDEMNKEISRYEKLISESRTFGERDGYLLSLYSKRKQLLDEIASLPECNIPCIHFRTIQTRRRISGMNEECYNICTVCNEKFSCYE